MAEIFRTGKSLGTQEVSGYFTCLETDSVCWFVPEDLAKVPSKFMTSVRRSEFPPQNTILAVQIESFEAMKTSVCQEDLDLYGEFEPNGTYFVFTYGGVRFSDFVY